MGHSESTWICMYCQDPNKNHPIQEHVTYQDMSCVGTPICEECGEDMDFVSEKWVEE